MADIILLPKVIIFFQIVFIDIVMAADNAIIIGLIASSFASKDRKRIILLGVFGAFLFRVIFAAITVQLLQYPILKVVGGALLIWIIVKLIKDLDGIPIIVRTYKNIVSTNLFKEVIVVTDADEIVEILKRHNIKFLKSLKSHNTGTDRIAEFADKFNSDIIVNVQGDEPFINKDDLIKIINEFKCDSNNLVNVVSLMIKLSNIDEINNPNNVKVVVDNNNDSILFSRSIIPFDRDDLKPNYYKHIGVYAFRTLYLKKFAKYDQTPLEKAEMIEALRIVEHGEKIRMIEIFKEHVSIDTIDDLKMAESILKQK